MAQIESIKKSNPTNLMAAGFDVAYFNQLDDKLKARLLEICNSGIVMPDSSMGCYASMFSVCFGCFSWVDCDPGVSCECGGLWPVRPDVCFLYVLVALVGLTVTRVLVVSVASASR